MAEVPDIQARALGLIMADPEASRILQGQVRRLDPDAKIIPNAATPEVMLDKRISEATAPLLEQVKSLQTALQKKDTLDFHESQRAFMRREYGMSEKSLDELAEWMEKDADGNIYKSYEAAHKYRQALTQPTLPTGSATPNRINPLTHRPVGGDEPWRQDMADPKKRGEVLKMSRADQRAKAQAEAQKAREEFRATHQ